METLPASTLRKPNIALVMVPKTGKLSLLTRKMYNVLLLLTQQQLPEVRPANGLTGVDAGHMFRAPLSAVVGPTIAKGSDSDPKTEAKKCLTAMRRMEADWEAPDERSDVIWESVSLLSQVRLEKANGQIWVSWALPPALLLALTEVDKYTTIDLLANVAPLTRYASVALYEICARYKNNPSGVSNSNSPEWWVDALLSSPAPIDPTTGKKKLREWRKIKGEIVQPAIEEINEKTDLTISLIERKTGKAVTQVQFAIQKKKAPSHDAVLSEEIALLAARLSVPLSALAQLVKSGKYSKGAIMLALTKLDVRAGNRDLEPVDNPLAYLRATLDDQAKYIAQPGADADSVRKLPSPPPETVAPQRTWGDIRAAELKDEFLALPAEQQQEYATATYNAMLTLAKTPASLRRFKTGEWKTSSLLLAQVVDQYAKQIYGADWRQEHAPAQTTGVIDV